MKSASKSKRAIYFYEKASEVFNTDKKLNECFKACPLNNTFRVLLSIMGFAQKWLTNPKSALLKFNIRQEF